MFTNRFILGAKLSLVALHVLLLTGCFGPSLDSGIPVDKQCFLILMRGTLKKQAACESLGTQQACLSSSGCVWSDMDPWGRPTDQYQPCWTSAARTCEEAAANLGCLRIVSVEGSPRALPNQALYAPCRGGSIAHWYQRIGKIPHYIEVSGPGEEKSVSGK